MAKQKTFFTELSEAPWWFALATGAIGGLAIYWLGFLAKDFAAKTSNPFLAIYAQVAHQFAPTAALVFVVLCLMATVISLSQAHKRRALLAQAVELNRIKAIPWADFERLMGEVFRRQGYRVSEVGLGGPDGGIDLELRKPGELVLVQCKLRTRSNIGVSVIREMAGLIAHHQATAAIVVTTTSFTQDAQSFASGKPIQLIDGPQLLQLTSSVSNGSIPETPAVSTPLPAPLAQPTAVANTVVPACPRCGAAMVQRTNKTTGSLFWGCTTFPRCRATLSAAVAAQAHPATTARAPELPQFPTGRPTADWQRYR